VQSNERGDEFPPGTLAGTCLTRNRKLAAAVLKSQVGRLQTMLGTGERLAETAAAELEQQARQAMQRTLQQELSRLRQLAEAGAGVRPEEIAHLEMEQQALVRHLARIHLRLDAARVIVSH
jgi:ATP-dependent helicase HepA